MEKPWAKWANYPAEKGRAHWDGKQDSITLTLQPGCWLLECINSFHTPRKTEAFWGEQHINLLKFKSYKFINNEITINVYFKKWYNELKQHVFDWCIFSSKRGPDIGVPLRAADFDEAQCTLCLHVSPCVFTKSEWKYEWTHGEQWIHWI